MTPGERIKALREIHDYSTLELAKWSTVDEQDIIDYESNDSTPSAHDAMRLSLTLCCSKEFILEGGPDVAKHMRPDPELVRYCEETYGGLAMDVYAAMAAIDTDHVVGGDMGPGATKFVPPFTYKSRDMEADKRMLDALAIFTTAIRADARTDTKDAMRTVINVLAPAYARRCIDETYIEKAVRIASRYREFLAVGIGMDTPYDVIMRRLSKPER